MKLRLHDNALRLRLSRTDLAKLAATGCVEEAVTFEAGRILTYRIAAGIEPEISAIFDGSTITVQVPELQLRVWAATEQVGIENLGGSLKIVMEKDFECLHSEGPPDASAFPNPARNLSKAGT